MMMNNSGKYSVGLGRNSSPIRSSAHTAPKQKYYSAQEVNRIVRSAFQPKIQFLVQQLQERQQMIAKLNSKLNDNDQKLIQQSQIIQSYARRNRDTQGQAHMGSIVAQVVGDKLKQFNEAVGRQLKAIASRVQQKYDFRKLQAMVGHQIQTMRTTVNQFIDGFKQKSNAYWQKIKDALGKLNSKVSSNEKDVMDLNVKLDNFIGQRMQERQSIAHLQNSQHVVKNLVQLKKSVNNIYENYQAVLNLQRGFRMKVQQENGDSIWQQQLGVRDQTIFKNQSGFKQQVGVRKHTTGPSESLVALEYSKEDAFASIIRDQQQQITQNDNVKQNTTQPILSPIMVKPNRSVDLLQLQRTTPHRRDDSSFSLNTSNQLQSRLQNNTLLINLSLQTRKQMCLGAKERLLELMEIKGLARPLQVRYDEQINYLKSNEGNYLFDLKGNMFKIDKQELQKLQTQGIVVRNNHNKKISLSSSKVKKTKC